MDGIWTWLKRANARAVFICSLAGLVIVIGWWTWRLLTPSTFVTPAIAPAPAEPAASGLGLLEILARQRATFTNRTARNPFLLPESMQPQKPEAVKPASADPGASATAAAQVKPSPPPPKRETITLKYRGVMRRADGTLTALIEDSRSHRASFYPVGTNVLGLKIERVAPEELSILRGEDQRTVVKRGAAASFEGPSHAN